MFLGIGYPVKFEVDPRAQMKAPLVYDDYVPSSTVPCTKLRLRAARRAGRGAWTPKTSKYQKTIKLAIHLLFYDFVAEFYVLKFCACFFIAISSSSRLFIDATNKQTNKQKNR